MTVYLVIDSGGYEGEHDVFITGIYSTMEKAHENFVRRVRDSKLSFGEFVDDEEYVGPDEEYEEKFVPEEGWWFEETETDFYAEESDRCSRNWTHIWIEEREVM